MNFQQPRTIGFFLFLTLLALAPAVFAAAPVATRPAPFPSYTVGDTGTLILTTSPAQPHQLVYRFRFLNGEPDGGQPTEIDTTDSAGRFEVEVTLPPESVGHYTGEQFAVGSPSGPRSNTLSYYIHASNAPSASRPAPFPDYVVGDTAVLVLSTSPAQPNQPVYRYRYFRGQPDGVQGALIGHTDSQGVFNNQATIDIDNIGQYTQERFAVGTLGGPKSSALAYDVHASNPPSAFRASPFPNYVVGDTATLDVTTSPAQPFQDVYRYRRKDNQDDGDQPTEIGTTDSQGRLHRSLTVTSAEIGSYSHERFAVGTPGGPRSSSLTYVVSSGGGGPNPPIASRPAPFPDYVVGDVSRLIVTTNPVQAFAPVYRYRLLNNLPDGDQPTHIEDTDSSGRYDVSVVLPPESVGTYTDERFAVGDPTGPTSAPLNYTISAGSTNAPTAIRLAPYPNYHVGDTASLTVTTSPAQPREPVYRFLTVNGQPSGPQPPQVDTTDSFGRYQVSGVLGEEAIGVYTDERYAVGDPNGPTSAPLAYNVQPDPASVNPPIALRPSPFPIYHVGETATLVLATDPPQPQQPIYRYRRLNLAPDGWQPTQIGTTDFDGRYEVSLVLKSGSEGVYTDERFAVDDPNGPTSVALHYTVLPQGVPLQPPNASRPEPYPAYRVGDTATLLITTNPVQPRQPVLRFRQKDGEDDGAQPTLIGHTDASGRFENTVPVPAEAIGVYTDEQFAVGEMDGPRSTALNYTVSGGTPSGEVVFTDVEPKTIDTGTLTVLTLTGENFTVGSTVFIPDGQPSGSFDEGKAAGTPTVRVLSVAPDGTSMEVEIDTTSSNAVDDFELLAVDNGVSEKAQAIRLIGPGPVVDAWTPSVPYRGQTFVFTLLGDHFTNATITPPEGVTIQVLSRLKQRVMGLMTISSSAPTGNVLVEVTGNGHTVYVPMLIPTSRHAETQERNLLAGSEVESEALDAGNPAPRLMMQELQIAPRMATRYAEVLKSADRLGYCISYSITWHFTWPIVMEVITFDVETGGVGNIAGVLGVGDQLDIGAFALSLTLEAALSIEWTYCSGGYWFPPQVCFAIVVAAEVPGGNAAYTYRSCFGVAGASGTSSGATTRADFSGGDCARVDNGPILDGVGTSTVTQTGCCPQQFSLEMEGTTFGEPFYVENLDVGETEPTKECCEEESSALGFAPTCPAPPQLLVEEVSFTSDHTIYKDQPGSAPAISDPVWTDADHNAIPEKNEAVAYTRGRTLEIAAKFKVDLPPTSTLMNAVIRGTGRSSGITVQATGVTVSGPEVTVTLTSTSTLPSTTQHYDPEIFDWEFSADGTTFASAGQSSHEMFVTLADPIAINVNTTTPNAKLYLSVLHLAIGTGGAGSIGGAAQKTWSSFARPSGGPADIQTWQGSPLYYYKDGFEFDICAEDVKALLTGSGSGQCGSFANLLMASFAANGIPSNRTVVSSTDGSRFLVPGWKYSAVPSFPLQPTYRWKLDLVIENSGFPGMVPANNPTIYGDMESLIGIPGQNTLTPSEKAFGLHVIVLAPAAAVPVGADRYLDPSYGMTYSNSLDFHTNAVAGYYRAYPGAPLGSYAVRKPDIHNRITFIVLP